MKWGDKKISELLNAMLALENEQEARQFLRDLMTETEIEEFSRRLWAASMLMQNIPYTDIQKETGLSSTTVARVSRWLENGKGGYKIVLSRLHHNNPA